MHGNGKLLMVSFKGICTHGKLRLMDGASQYDGRIEICNRGVWGTICGSGIMDDSIASVVCKALNLPSFGE